MRLNAHKRNWEDLADVDPLWAILSDSRRQHGGWNLDEFFQSGEQEIANMMASAERLGYPSHRRRALDFGCGVGRLTRALASRFERCDGIDVSERMIQRAQELNSEFRDCHFSVNNTNNLQIFPDDTFDLIYSSLVLQHIPHRGDIEGYILEFIRVLRHEGLLVFQLPSHISLRHRLQPRRRLYSFLRSIGVSHTWLYNTLHLNPMKMSFIPVHDVVDVITRSGARVVHIETKQTPHYQSSVYSVTK